MRTLNPSVVSIVGPKVGINAVPVKAVPVTVLLPSVYPERVVVCTMVAVAPGDKPVTLNTLVDPFVDITATDPVETVGVTQENALL